jgi:D-3-phosphoglycerate dehydrogenase
MTNTWRILVTDGLAPEGLALLRPHAKVVESTDLASPADAWIVRGRTRITRSSLAAARPRLKVVGRAGAGVDNIELEAARALAVVVVHAPQAATDAVAEHALAMMLALARNLVQADCGLRRGEWHKADLIGSELGGKTLGILGFGRIGQALAARAAALGMHVTAHDPLISSEDIRAAGAEPVDDRDLLARSDYLSVHVPLNDSTRGRIDAAALHALKPGARLISTSRGGVVDEEALLGALESGHVVGAALDVFAHEPPGSTRLLQHPSLIATPHIAAQTHEAQARAGIDIAEEVLAALHGEALRWRVV